MLRNAGTLYAQIGQHERAYELLDELFTLRVVGEEQDLIGELSGPLVVFDDDYLPIVTVAPAYPPRAVARGLEGYVIVRFTVTETGTTDDIVVVESSASLFEQAAIDSAAKWKYRPRMVDGQPVAVPGVTNRINFQLEPEAEDAGPEA